MLNLRPFQIFLLAIFAFLAFVSLFLLRGFTPSTSEEAKQFGDQVVIWGTFPYQPMTDVINQIAEENEAFEVVQYVSVPVDEFNGRFLNALAEGQSPDLIVLPHRELVAQRSKLLPIPYDTDGFSARDLRDQYVDGAEIFALQDGVYAQPLVVDPLVLYWNRDIFAGAGLASAPASWEDLVANVAQRITQRDVSRNIIRSTVAFGEFTNVRNASAVLSLLMLQSGSQLVQESDRGYEVLINESAGDGRPPLEAALQFYTDFANVSNPLYNWNRAQAEDRQAFIASDLALYFGLASEASMIQSRNPNLNFDVALPPQGSAATVKRTYGEFYGLAIPRASRNSQGAFAVARTLGTAQNSLNLAFELDMAPVRRNALAAEVNDPFTDVAYQAALIARGWLQPTTLATDAAFGQMVEDVNSSRARVGEAVSDAISRLILAY